MSTTRFPYKRWHATWMKHVRLWTMDCPVCGAAAMAVRKTDIPVWAEAHTYVHHREQ